MKKDFSLLLDSPKPVFKEYNQPHNVFTIEDHYSAKLFNETSYDYFLKDVYDFKETFSAVNTLMHKNFFKELGLNTPNLLNQTKSLKRFSNSTDMLKLSACLMRAGMKSQAINLISVAVFRAFTNLKTNLPQLSSSLSFKDFYYLLSSSYMQSAFHKSLPAAQIIPFTLFSTLNASLVGGSAVFGSELVKNEDV
jgi:hypothetical protein